MRGRGTMAVAPDGRTVATGRIENGEAYIDVLELPSGRRKASWRAGWHARVPVALQPRWEVTVRVGLTETARGFNPNTGFGQIWDSGTGRPTSPLMAGTSDAIYTPAGDRLVTQSWNQQLRP